MSLNLKLKEVVVTIITVLFGERTQSEIVTHRQPDPARSTHCMIHSLLYK